MRSLKLEQIKLYQGSSETYSVSCRSMESLSVTTGDGVIHS
jgi:hypothetical protein